MSAAVRRRMPSLSAQIFIALGLGIAAGLFFGELIQPVQLLGDIFIGLLQMTVLPYILVSLIGGLGRLSYAEARLLAVKGGAFVLLFWAVSLTVTLLFTLSFPGWESATFFSTSLVESAKEFDLLLNFANNPGKVYTRSQLLDVVWGYGHEGYEHTVNSHINRLRAKIEKDPAHPSYVLTVWGVGYKFADV